MALAWIAFAVVTKWWNGVAGGFACVATIAFAGASITKRICRGPGLEQIVLENRIRIVPVIGWLPIERIETIAVAADPYEDFAESFAGLFLPDVIKYFPFKAATAIIEGKPGTKVAPEKPALVVGRVERNKSP